MERRHEGNMTKLVVCLVRERGIRWDVSIKIQASLTNLFSYAITKDKWYGIHTGEEVEPIG